MNKETVLYQLTETSDFMMSFVLVTKQNNVIILDGGRPEDMPLLKEYVGGRHISAWILTHAHVDHISGFVSEMERNGCADFDLEKVYYHFPPYEVPSDVYIPDPDYYRAELDETLPSFLAIEGQLGDRAHVVVQGESVQIDECRLDFLFTYHRELTSNLMNDSSLVCKVTTPNKSVLFLGDLGPDGGDLLYRESRHLLASDIVQMAHHGHMNVGMEVYAAIAPKACLWCAPDWLYAEEEVPHYLADTEKLRRMKRVRMYGTAVTRRWMELLGAQVHYVTKDGTQRIVL